VKGGEDHVLLLPAIDLRGGQCVRLRQGDYSQETVFGADPAAIARRWVEQGAECLHVVDLDGARQARPVNVESIRAIVRTAGVPCQLGGGIRQEEHIANALGWGVARVILGTKALQDPTWCAAMCMKYPGKVALGIDARDGRVAIEGWRQATERPALDLARECSAFEPAAIIYTDIGKDGMLTGPNLEATAELARAVSVPVIASGGVTSLDDILQLARANLAGCILGRALYEGRLDLKAAMRLIKTEDSHRH
jgi:phosphoribosylformimino-5-aminoimidazole carboxamide ribotide isomerase